MPTVIPVQTRLSSPGSAGFQPASAPPPPATPAALTPTDIRRSPLDISHSAPHAAAPRAALALHIDALVLHGFSGVDGRRVGAAFEQELARLLAQAESPLSEYAPGASALAESSAATSAPLSAEFAPGRPELTGRRAARALHARLRA